MIRKKMRIPKSEMFRYYGTTATPDWYVQDEDDDEELVP